MAYRARSAGLAWAGRGPWGRGSWSVSAVAACALLAFVLQLAAGPAAASWVWRRRATLGGMAAAVAERVESVMHSQYAW